MYLGYQNNKIKFYVEQTFDEPTIEKWEETNDRYVLSDDCTEYVLYDAEKEAQKERERINMLYLTAADVERAIYEDKGMDFDDVLALVEQQGVGIDVKRIKIEFKANNFYRGNQYVVAIGALLGYTSEQLDYLFENGHF